MIIIKNKRCSHENILRDYPNAEIIDVTSKGEYKTLAPFYPHGGIPVPFSGTVAADSWFLQGVKYFISFLFEIRAWCLTILRRPGSTS